MKKLSNYESGNVCKLMMPKEMSDWFDERRNSYQYARVVSGGVYGYACKSSNCTVVMFPNWNCDSQFKDIVNALRK